MSGTDAAVKDRILFITDLHFWEIVRNPLKLLNKRLLGNANVILRRSREFRMEHAESFADAAAATGVRTVLLGGDFTSTATEGEFERAARFVRGLAERGLELIAIPGNHDVYTFESVRARRFERHLGQWVAHKEYPCRVTLPGGTPLVLVPTVCPNLVSSKGRIRGEEIEKTRALLEGCPPGPVLVAGHYPVLHETPGYRSGPSRRLRNAEALRAALGGSGRRILYMAGHVHRFSYVEDSAYPGLSHVTSGAFFLRRHGGGADGAFSEIEVHGEGFAVYNHVHEGAWRREAGVAGRLAT